jgi:hypothetical protein
MTARDAETVPFTNTASCGVFRGRRSPAYRTVARTAKSVVTNLIGAITGSCVAAW